MAEWNIATPATEYYDHTSPDIHKIVNEVAATPEVAIDTETTGLTVWKDVPLYWSLAWGSRRMTLNASALPYFEQVFRMPNKRWVFANAKYDAHILANVGVHIAGELVDIQVMHALLYDDRSHKLKDMNEDLFHWRWADFQDTFGKIGKKQSAEDRIRKAEVENFPLLVEYAANDAWGTLQCHDELKKQLQKAYTHSLFRDRAPYIETLWDLFHKIEVPYTKVLWKNERNGVLIDQEYLARIEPIAKQEIQDLERAINKEAGCVLNPNSTKQLREYFFGKLGVEPLKVTKGGKSGVRNPSVDKGFLEHYSAKIPMAAHLLKHRSLSKLYGTYIVGIGELLDPHGRIHTRYNQDVARTGRLSSSDPNLQNIPKEENDKWKLRGAFVAAPDKELIVADYEQLEMRLLACASLEPGMIEVINRGWDIHMGNAAMIFGYPYEEIEQAKKIDKQVKQGKLDASAITQRILELLHARNVIKTIGFGVIYGMGPQKMAMGLGISVQEAENNIAMFKQKYPAIDSFSREAIAETAQTGYSFTILGRRRNLPQIASHRRDERGQAERQAVNTPIQGGAADVVKMAQLLLDQCGLDTRFDCHSQMQVHDELMHECPKGSTEYLKREIKDYMEHPFCVSLAVPLAVDINSGNSWLEAK
jgi:DNA polymerase-1